MTAVRVSSKSSPLGQDVTIRQFHLVADEPLAVGGNDAGPSPFEWVLAGLGACTAMTIKLYATRKGWHVDHITIDLNLQKVEHHQLIRTNLQLEGTLTSEQRQRLLEIADRCPVHRLLIAGAEIQTVLLPESSSRAADQSQ